MVYMKVLREVSRNYKGKDYFKFKINIPEGILEKAGIKTGDELKASVEGGKIILKKNS